MRSASVAASSRSWVTSTIGIATARRSSASSRCSFGACTVDRREGLVEQQHRRLARQRAGDRDALLLPAGKRRRPPVLEAGEVHQRRAARARAARARPREMVAERRHDVAERGHVREQRVVLEHEADPRAGAAARRCRARCRTRSSPPQCDPPVAAACRARRSRAGSWSCRCPTGRPAPAARPARSRARHRAESAPSARSRRCSPPRAHPSRRPTPARQRCRSTAMATNENSSSTADMTPARARCRTPAPGRRSRSRWSWSRPGCCRPPSARRRTRPACARRSAPAPVRMPGQASGSSMRQQRLPAATGRSTRPPRADRRDRLEGALHRLDRERQVEDDRGEQQALEA